VYAVLSDVKDKTNSTIQPVESVDPVDSLQLLEQAEATLAAELASGTIAAVETVTPTPQRLSRLSILVPVYNERWSVADCLRRLAQVSFSLETEIVVIDDGSTDGSDLVVESLATEIPNLTLIRQPKNGGKGAAIRRGIAEMTGDIAVIQDADLEYDPADLPNLIAPVLDGRADAVFGSRFAGTTRKCLPFWHAQLNGCLTQISNMVTGTSLTDMETCYKVVRGDVLRELRLARNSFTIEPELTCRLAQWGARIYEAPISYSGRSFDEGKKIRAIDGLKALATLLHTRFIDRQFSIVPEDAMQRSLRRATRYNRSLVEMAKPFLGDRVLDAGAGIGNLSGMLVHRERLVLAEYDTHRAERLRTRFGNRSNVRVCESDLADREFADEMSQENLDTVFCCNTLQQIGPDFLTLRNFFKMLRRGGRCVLFVPNDLRLFSPIDISLGHQRRYEPDLLANLMRRAGFEIVQQAAFNKIGGLGWRLMGLGLGRKRFGSMTTMAMDRMWPVTRHVDRLLPLAPMTLMMVGRKA
jgi:glycosyltransferase involved in cell wall biosynthesis